MVRYSELKRHFETACLTGVYPMKKLICLFVSLAMLLGLCACGGQPGDSGEIKTPEPQVSASPSEPVQNEAQVTQEQPPEASPEPSQEPNFVPDYIAVDYDTDFLYDIESDVITALEQPCTEQGTVVTLDYEAPAYALNEILGADLTLEKSVSIYLPFGYDESKQYNVLYLLHGTGGDNEYWLQGKKTGEPTRNVLDNMIQQGICQPLIVVTPNWYGNAKGRDYKLTDEQSVAYGSSVNDSYLLSPNDVWTQFFQFELRNDIMPLVESQYATYAGGDTSPEGLTASRDHRALAGLSRGAMAVARAGLTNGTDYFSWFGSFSGVWSEDDPFVDALSASEYPIHFWYNGNGTEDFSAENHINFHNMVMERLPDRFVDGENYALVVKKDASHSYENWITDLYNMLLISFVPQ